MSQQSLRIGRKVSKCNWTQRCHSVTLRNYEALPKQPFVYIYSKLWPISTIWIRIFIFLIHLASQSWKMRLTTGARHRFKTWTWTFKQYQDIKIIHHGSKTIGIIVFFVCFFNTTRPICCILLYNLTRFKNHWKFFQCVFSCSLIQYSSVCL